MKYKTTLTCRLVTYFLFIGHTVFFSVLFYRQYCYPNIFHSDLNSHIMFGRTGKNLYSLTYVLLGLVDRIPYSGIVTSLMLTAFILFGVVATKVLLNFLVPNYDKWIVWLMAWLSNMVVGFYMPNIPFWGENTDYTGMIQFNVYHNPTYIMMKPFAVLSVYYFFKILNKYVEKSLKIKEWVILSSLMFVTTLFKPNFMIGFSISILIILVYDFIKHKCKNVLNYICLGSTVFPSIVLMFFQQLILFNDDSKIKIGFMTGLNAMTGNPSIKILLSFVFPILILVFSFKSLINARFYAFAWVHMLVNLSITVFLFESGDRISNGNFVWGSFLACGILFIVSLSKFFDAVKNRKLWICFCSGALGIHFFCWVNYVFGLFRGQI